MQSWQLHNFQVDTKYVSTPASLGPPLHFTASLLINNVLITGSKAKNGTMQIVIEHETRQYVNSVIETMKQRSQ